MVLLGCLENARYCPPDLKIFFMKREGQIMAINVGDKLPQATFKVMSADGPADLAVADLCAGKKVVIFAVPGAFTPTCHAKHLPGFLENLEAFKAKGVDEIACLSVNDVFVMDAWARDTGAAGKIAFLADGSGQFTKAIGMELDLMAGGLGIRSKRYAMLVNDGTVERLNIEEESGVAVISSAEELLGQL